MRYGVEWKLCFSFPRVHPDSQTFENEIPRFSWLPKIETVLIDNPTIPPHGGGEPPIVCMGGVIANAIFDAKGVRLFELPMTAERIKKGLSGNG